MLPYPAKTTREVILAVFLAHPKLTARQVWSKSRIEFNKDISYKAVYRVLQELQNQEMLLRQGKFYCLSNTWISAVKSAVSAAEKKMYT